MIAYRMHNWLTLLPDEPRWYCHNNNDCAHNNICWTASQATSPPSPKVAKFERRKRRENKGENDEWIHWNEHRREKKEVRLQILTDYTYILQIYHVNWIDEIAA